MIDRLTINFSNLTDDEKQQLMALVDKSNKSQYIRWMPSYGDNYASVNANGSVSLSKWCDDQFDKWKYSTGNVFKTYEEAEFYKQELLVHTEMEDLAREYNDGWSPSALEHFKKYYIDYKWDYEEAKVSVIASECYEDDRLPKTLYFKSRDLCYKAIDTIGEDRLLKYWFKRS